MPRNYYSLHKIRVGGLRCVILYPLLCRLYHTEKEWQKSCFLSRFSPDSFCTLFHFPHTKHVEREKLKIIIYTATLTRVLYEQECKMLDVFLASPNSANKGSAEFKWNAPWGQSESTFRPLKSFQIFLKGRNWNSFFLPLFFLTSSFWARLSVLMLLGHALFWTLK